MATISQNLLLLSSVKTGKEARPLILSIFYGMEDAMKSIESIGSTLSETFPVAVSNYNTAIVAAVDAFGTMGMISTSIPDRAYAGNSEITSFTGSFVRSIGARAFASCVNLETVDFPVASYIGGTAFQDCYSLAAVSFPAATDIGDYAFYKCSALTSVNFPSAINIGSNAFNSCASLTNADFKAAASIGQNAFSSCIALTNVSVPAVTTIGQYAFQSCHALASISLPAATNIGSYAFFNCINLSIIDLTEVSQPPSLISNAFFNTPISKSSYLGYFGSIWIPEGMMSAFLLTSGWSYYSERLTEVEEIDDPGWEGWG